MDNTDLSLAWYHYLCNVIGTEHVVNMRRQILDTYGNATGFRVTNISSGSKAEGLDLHSSDFDVMVLFNEHPVYENSSSVRHYPGTFPLVMDTSDCKLGFTLLKENNPYSCGLPCAGERYFPNTLKEFVKLPGLIIHGPCLSTEDGTMDSAMCVRCSNWISQANPWIIRSLNSWASTNVINSILNFGVLFVPIGCKNSPNIDLEWRISFSYAEKLLIWSFNHVQLLCYALLKIVFKEIIKLTTADLLCSYFLKTIMLWVCEDTKSSQWKKNTILSCFMGCFDRLIYCVRYKTCAHYFIPENDLFAERFDRQQQSRLLSTLNQLRSLGWTCLLQTQTLCSFKTFLEPALLPLEHKVSYYPSLNYLGALDYVYTDFSFLSLIQSVYSCIRKSKNEFYIYMISILSGSINKTPSIVQSRLSGNKQAYNIYRKQLSHRLIGLNHDAVSGWLMLASFFYVNKQYQICLQLLSDCLLWCTPDKIILDASPSNEEQTRFNLFEKELGQRPLNLIRKVVMNRVNFSTSSQMFPKEMGVSNGRDTTRILPIEFGIFLKFLCSNALGNEQEIHEKIRILNNDVKNLTNKTLDIKFQKREGN